MLVLLSVQHVNAQNNTIKGVVLDAVTKEAIIGANVVVKGTTIGTATDMDGNFEFMGPVNSTLVVSYVGYMEKEVLFTGSIPLEILMEDDSFLLGEIVAIGYGSQRRKELTGSVAGLKENDLNKGVQTNPMGMIQGKVAGLNISKPNSGDPNADYVFQLRGTSSLQGNTSPLIIIDGIPQGDLSAIPQDDIESIDILKDGSAAAIYGTRGTNGVILVTTKRGSAGKMSTSYRGYLSTSSILNKLNILNRTEFLANGGNDRGADTDWIGELTRTPFIHSHNLSITGGTNEFNYRASLSYKDNPGIAIKTGYDELIGRFVANQTLLEGRVSIAYDATYRRYNRETSNNDNSAFKHATHYNPTAPVYDSSRDDSGGYYQLDVQNYSNPVAQIKQSDRHTKGGTFQGSARIRVDIIDGLRAQIFGSIRHNDQAQGRYSSREIYNTSDYGRATRRYDNRQNKTIETTIDYVKNFGKHNWVLLGGYSYEHNFHEWFEVFNSNYDSDVFSYYNLGAGSKLINDPSQSMMQSFVTQDNLVSFLGRVNYNYDERYLLSASIRHEASTRLGANHKWGTFPAVSLGWRLSNEAFMKDIDWINELKLRLGFGVTGNMPSDNFKSLPMMGVTGRYYDHSSGRWISAYGPTQNLNEDIKWEKKAEWNLGIDWALLNNRVNITIDAYSRKVTDLLYIYKVPTPPYQYPEMLANVGDATSKGLEFSISAIPVRNRDFSWNSSINFSFNDNRIDKFSNEHFQTEWIEKGYLSDGDLGGLNNTPLLRLVPSGKVGDFYLPVFKGFTDDGKWIFEDVNDDGSFSFENDRRFVGNAQPDFTAGWTNELTYKNLTLAFTLRAVVGNDVFNVGRMALENQSIAGQEKNMLKSVLNSPLRDAGFPSDYYLEDGSFLKMDNVTLGYNIPFKENKYIKDLHIYFTAQNVFTITGYKGVDPEVDMVGIDNMGIERTRYFPTVRSYVLGLNITF
jgi:TonB-linked SusC/RagA family outer membrane protein